MSNTQIDTLLQLTLPRSDGASPSRARDENSPFDQLFQQAGSVKTAANSPPPSSSQSFSTKAERGRDSQEPTNPTRPSSPATASADVPREKESRDEDDEIVAESSPGAKVAVTTVPTAQSAAKENSDATSEAATEVTIAIDDPTAATKKARGKPNVQATTADSVDAALREPAAESAEAATAESKLQASAEVAAKELPVAAATAEDAAVESATAADPSGVADLTAEALPTANGQGVDEGHASGDDRPARQRVVSDQGSAPLAVHDLPNTETNDASSNQAVDSGSIAVTANEFPSGESLQGAREEALPAESETSSNDSNASNLKRETARSPQVQPAPTIRLAVATPPGVAVPAAATNATVKGDGPIIKDSGPRQIGSGPKEGVLATFARFERTGALASRGRAHAGEGRDAPRVDPAKFVSRVARAIQTAQDRGTPLLLRLNPPELGSLKLEMSMQQGTLSASVEADNQAAKQLLLESLPALRERLADQNIRIERFDVDVRRDSDGREQPTFDWRQQQHESNQGRQPHHFEGSHRRGGETVADAVTIVPHSITTTTINVVA